jgi:RNA polymerase sigma-70 factor (ECF subfamily)
MKVMKISEAVRERLDILYCQNRKSLARVAKKVTKDFALAEDAVHDVFLSLMEMEELPADFEKNPEGYLHRSARNKAVDILRSRECRRLAEEPIDGLEIMADANDPAGDPATLRRLREAIAGLDPETAEILSLLYDDGHKIADIARIKGASRYTLASTMRRTREKLAESIRMQERQEREEREERKGGDVVR